jgi:hypothetical protein
MVRSAAPLNPICPARAVGAAIIMPRVNAEAMNEHLKEISTQVTQGAQVGIKWRTFDDVLVDAGVTDRCAIGTLDDDPTNQSFWWERTATSTTAQRPFGAVNYESPAPDWNLLGDR